MTEESGDAMIRRCSKDEGLFESPGITTDRLLPSVHSSPNVRYVAKVLPLRGLVKPCECQFRHPGTI